MQDSNENIIIIQGKQYNLDKLSNEDVLKLNEYIIKRGNYLVEKIDSEIKKIS